MIKIFTNIMILLAITVTFLSIINENTTEPFFSGLLDRVNEKYNKHKRNIRHTALGAHKYVYHGIKRKMRHIGF